MKLYTCSMSGMPKGVRRINGCWYEDTATRAVFLDTTVKSGDPTYAPTWPMVMGHKAGKISDAEYTAQYTEKMRASFKAHKESWHDLLDNCRQEGKSLVLLCYCTPGKFCHRTLLADMLVKVGEHLKIPVTYKGEYKAERTLIPVMNSRGEYQPMAGPAHVAENPSIRAMIRDGRRMPGWGPGYADIEGVIGNPPKPCLRVGICAGEMHYAPTWGGYACSTCHLHQYGESTLRTLASSVGSEMIDEIDHGQVRIERILTSSDLLPSRIPSVPPTGLYLTLESGSTPDDAYRAEAATLWQDGVPLNPYLGVDSSDDAGCYQCILLRVITEDADSLLDWAVRYNDRTGRSGMMNPYCVLLNE
jgi:hypothetical protein